MTTLRKPDADRADARTEVRRLYKDVPRHDRRAAQPFTSGHDPHLVEIVAGATALLMIAALPALAYRAIDLKGPHGYVLTASFDHVIGIRDGTDVRISGITVGHVVGVALDPNTYVADVTMKIDRGIRLPSDTVILEANGLVQGYSYWTFSDIFEENYFPSVPFQGGFGLLNIHGIAKPAYRAFQLLHELGTQMLPVEGNHETVDAWFVRGDQHSTLVLTNFALPRNSIETQQVSFALKSAKSATTASIQRIDLEHANAKRHWEQLGKPEYLCVATVDELKDLSQLP